VPESEDWLARQEKARQPTFFEVIRAHLPLTIYAVVMMTAFNFFSHGTQDLYPLFLQTQHHLDRGTVTTITIVLNIGAMVGGIAFGALSQRIGRRTAIVIAALLTLPVIYLWAFSTTVAMLALGAFLMQICVQGAWGVIPAHLNELSPPDIRGTFPGTVYQLGNLLAAANATIQSSIADHLGGNYAIPLAGTAGIVAVVIAVLVGLGREGRDVRMGREQVQAAE
jgi:SHS family lactate transporter-like MFS transporter